MTTKYKPHQAMTDENEVIVGIKPPSSWYWESAVRAATP